MSWRRQGRRWHAGSRGRVLLVVAAVVLGAVVVGLLAARGGSPAPLSPTSTGPSGTAALVEVLSELGASVEIGRPDPDPDAAGDERSDNESGDDRSGDAGSGDAGSGAAAVDRALVLTDDLSDAERKALRSLAERGATVVVAAPASPLAAEAATTVGPTTFTPDPEPSCAVAALADLGEVDAGGAAFQAGPGSTGCFPVPGGSWLVVTPTGDGHVVSVGGPGWLTNAELDRADHAALAAALLAPRDGGEVLVVEPGGVAAAEGQGLAGLAALVPGWVWAVLAQLGVAAGALIAWRARRLGRPVSEPQPVALPGSELVVAMGDLLQVTGAAAHAGRRLRDALADELAGHLGLDADASPEHLAEAAASAGADPEAAWRALAGPLPAGDAELMALGRDVEAVRAAASGGRAAGGAATAGVVRAGA